MWPSSSRTRRAPRARHRLALVGCAGLCAAASGTSFACGPTRDPLAEGASATVRQQLVAEVKLTSSSGGPGDALGTALAIHDVTVLLGAPSADGRVVGSGAVAAFRRGAGDVWNEVAELAAPDGVDGDGFGASVALDASTAVVGAPRHGSSGPETGAAYVFRDTGAWAFVEKLGASDAQDYDLFGSSVAIGGSLILVGAPAEDERGSLAGATYAFELQGPSWRPVGKLLAADASSSDRFGTAVAISGSRAVVGAPDAGSITTGAAYVFEWSGTAWTQAAMLTPPDGTAGDDFGAAVALAGTTLVVGAPGSDAAATRSGAAYVFERQSGGAWTFAAKLVAADATSFDQLGASVAATPTVVAAGAPDAGTGAVYWMERQAALSWIPRGKVVPAGTTDDFGDSTGLSGTALAVGASADRERASRAGAGFVFERGLIAQGEPCTASYSCVGASCADGVCCDQDCTAPDLSCVASQTNATDGTCAPVADGTPCVVPSECGSGQCFDGVCCDVDCSALNTGCTRARTGQPDGTCAPTIPGAPCTSAAECASTHCVDGVCCDRACTAPAEACAEASTGRPDGTCAATVPGAPCTAATECASGYCADGYCCDGACDSPCESCDGSKTTAANGQCAPVREFTDPDDECAPSPAPGTCTLPGVCSGQRACLDCFPFQCQGPRCSALCLSDAECVAPALCVVASCKLPQQNGESCSRDVECESGHCVDDTCCAARCEAPCNACSNWRTGGPDGECLPIEDGRSPKLDGACPDDDDECGADGRCDGAGACRTATPAGRACGTSCTVGSEEQIACDGQGACSVTTSSRACLPYACDAEGSVCKSTCIDDGDCAPGATCSPAGECRLAAGECKDEVIVVDSMGKERSCSPYTCAGGVCRDTCGTTSDCAPRHTCDEGACVRREGASKDEDAGCGCTVPSRRPIEPIAFAVGAVALACLRRRRPRRVLARA